MLTEQQQKIPDFVRSGSGDVLGASLAGTGKSTTARYAVNAIRGLSRKKVLYTAFNKSIASDMESRLPDSVKVSTLHSAGYRELVLNNICSRNDFRPSKVVEIAETTLKSTKYRNTYRPKKLYSLKYRIQRAVSLAKSMLIEDPIELEIVCDRLGIRTDDLPEFGEIALFCLDKSNKSKKIDYDDMIYRPLRLIQQGKIRPSQYDYVVLDEAQDMSNSRQGLVDSLTNGRLISFADRNQMIYEFAGSNTRNFDELAGRESMTVFPMTVSFRCSHAVAREAQKFVPEFECLETAPEGIVEEIEEIEDVQKGDMVLCYRNLPLVRQCVKFIKQGVSCTVQGDDYKKDITKLIKLSKNNDARESITEIQRDFQAKLDKAAVEVGYEKAANKTWIKIHKEKCDLATFFLLETMSIQKALKLVEDTFLPEKADISSYDVIFSTIHKAKGREADRIFFMEYDALYNSAREDLVAHNLAYVAITRAKRDLFLIPKKNKQ